MIFKSKLFWASTLLFVLVTVVLVWFGYPPVVRKFSQNRTELKKLNAEIVTQKQFLVTLATLERDKDEVAGLYDKALLALPTKAQPEILLLQMDGLLNALGLGHAQLSLPLGQAAARKTTPSAEEEASSSATSSTTESTLTITGEINYDQLKTLLDSLKTLARWNRVKAVDVGVANSKMSVTVSTQVFWKPGTPDSFTSADNQFLTKARQVFGTLQAHTSLPNSKVEGRFGRSDPFAPE